MAGNSEQGARNAFFSIQNVERQIRSLKTALNSWVYGAYKTSFSKKGNFLYADDVARENAIIWIKNILGWKKGKANQYEVITKYINDMNNVLFLNKSDFELKDDGDSLTVIYRSDGKCVYLEACEWLASELALGVEGPCPRAIIFTAALEIGCGVRYKAKILEKEIGKKCVMKFTPTRKSRHPH